MKKTLNEEKQKILQIMQKINEGWSFEPDNEDIKQYERNADDYDMKVNELAAVMKNFVLFHINLTASEKEKPITENDIYNELQSIITQKVLNDKEIENKLREYNQRF